MKSIVDYTFWYVWFASVLMRYLWRSRRVSAWTTRNADRVYTLLQIATTVVRIEEGRYGFATIWAISALLGVLTWNRPPDDDDRKRRRREIVEKEETKDWSGMVPAQ